MALNLLRQSSRVCKCTCPRRALSTPAIRRPDSRYFSQIDSTASHPSTSRSTSIPSTSRIPHTPPTRHSSSEASSAPTPTPQFAPAVEDGEALESANPDTTTSYVVTRTSNGQLPVYSEIRKQHRQVWTVIRRIEGDVQALAEDLIKTFPKVPIIIKPQNNQVVLKSEMVLELKAFLTARGF